MPTSESPARLDRFLRLFADVREGEGATALLMALNIFLILTAYYILKPVREALILGEGSAELKSYMSAAQVGVLALAVPLYGRLVAAWPRMRLINVVTMFFIGCLIAFYLLAKSDAPLGVVFFVWIGVFNLMVPAQFWSFANDVYSKPEGERLFPIVAFGASLGAVIGARIADRLIGPLGIAQLMPFAAVVLGAQLGLMNYLERREHARVLTHQPVARPEQRRDTAQNAFALVFRTRYLLLIAMILLLLNFVNTTGEYILGSIVKERAVEAIASGSSGGLTEQQIIGDFYATYFSLVNGLGLLLQLFVVSRVVTFIGVGRAIMVLPILSFVAYNVLLFLPFLTAVLAVKVAENSTDYSLNNTVRNMLFLPCTREQKYSAKQAIDAFFFRMGDVLSAVLVFVGTQFLTLGAAGFASVNVLAAALWLLLAWRVGRRYDVLTEGGRAPVTTAA